MPASQAPTQQGDLFGGAQPGPRHRLFIALVPSVEEKKAVSRLADSLHGAYPQARRVKPERYHVTLHFLDESLQPREDLVRAACEAMDGWQGEPVVITLDHLLCLGNPKQPALTLAALHPDAALVAFWRGLQQRLMRAGFKQHVGRSFVPHLTLAHVPPRTAPVDVAAIELRPRSLHLIQSIDGEFEHQTLAEWPLG